MSIRPSIAVSTPIGMAVKPGTASTTIISPITKPGITIPKQNAQQCQDNASLLLNSGLLSQTNNLICLFIKLRAASQTKYTIYSWIGNIFMIITTIITLLGTSWLTQISTQACLAITIMTSLSGILNISGRSFNFGHIVIDCDICINRLTSLITEINSGSSVHNYDTFTKTLSVYKDRYNQDAAIEMNTVDISTTVQQDTLQPVPAVTVTVPNSP
jgi:hypothetical protein